MDAHGKTTDFNAALAATAAGLWIVSYFAARVAIEQLEPGSPLRLVAAVTPVIPFAWMLWLFIRGVRGADELERRIHLEALAVAFPLSMLMLMLFGLLELAVDLNPDNWSYRHLWPFMVIFWFLGLSLARHRYA